MSVNLELENYTLVNVDDLCGAALDWAVAITRGEVKLLSHNERLNVVVSVEGVDAFFCPSSRWSDAGPLIEEGKISLRCEGPGNEGWYAVTATGTKAFNTCDCFDAGGDTALEAAMRCYVKKFGSEAVEVPEVLIAELRSEAELNAAGEAVMTNKDYLRDVPLFDGDIDYVVPETPVRHYLVDTEKGVYYYPLAKYPRQEKFFGCVLYVRHLGSVEYRDIAMDELLASGVEAIPVGESRLDDVVLELRESGAVPSL